MKLLSALFLAALLTACTATAYTTSHNLTHPAATPSLQCPARDASSAVQWRIGDTSDSAQLARWCRAVGAPLFVASTSSTAEAPTLDELVTVSWNAHLAAGELPELIARLKSGAFTGGAPVTHFVLLVQELYRRGGAVPAFDAGDRTAFAIKGDPTFPDIDDHARNLGLSILYVPSMRNGAQYREDRGNAIISTEPLSDPLALELPLARQRRVSLAAAINVRTADGIRPLQIVDAHLEPLSSPETLWVFKNPRPHQVRALLTLLNDPRFTSANNAGVVLGGDFNTVRSGAGETAYHLARAWSKSLRHEDPRDTHMMGRLDYLFFNLQDGWTASTRRIDEHFGSDHFPVLGTFSPATADRRD